MLRHTILPEEEEFEDATEVIRICKLKKFRQHNGQMKKAKRTNNDGQNTTQKTKDLVISTTLKRGGVGLGVNECDIFRKDVGKVYKIHNEGAMGQRNDIVSPCEVQRLRKSRQLAL